MMCNETHRATFFLSPRLAEELGIKSLPFDVWRQLQDENKEKGKDGIDLLGGAAELYLEGVFWIPPSEKEVKESKTASKKK